MTPFMINMTLSGVSIQHGGINKLASNIKGTCFIWFRGGNCTPLAVETNGKAFRQCCIFSFSVK